MSKHVLKPEKVAEIFSKKKEAQVGMGYMGAEDPLEKEQMSDPHGSFQPIYPLQQAPLANITDRRYEIRKMMKNFNKGKVLLEEKVKMLEQLLTSNGQNTEGFLDDPSIWDEKTWHDTVRKTERLVRDINETLMTLRTDVAEPEDKSEALPRKPDEQDVYLKTRQEKKPGLLGGEIGSDRSL